MGVINVEELKKYESLEELRAALTTDLAEAGVNEAMTLASVFIPAHLDALKKLGLEKDTVFIEEVRLMGPQTWERWSGSDAIDIEDETDGEYPISLDHAEVVKLWIEEINADLDVFKASQEQNELMKEQNELIGSLTESNELAHQLQARKDLAIKALIMKNESLEARLDKLTKLRVLLGREKKPRAGGTEVIGG